MSEAREMVRHAGASMREFGERSPEAMKGFGELFENATKDGAVDHKTKEMVVIALGIIKQCKYCIAAHMRKAIKAGMTKEELSEICMVVTAMGGGPALMYAKVATDYYDELTQKTD